MTTPAPGPGEKRKRTITSNGNSDHPASKHPRPGSEIDGSFSPSTPLPDQKPSEDLPVASRSRKGKERASDPEEPTREVANVAKEGVDAKLQVKCDSSHASQLALNETRQSGLSQEQLEAMTKFFNPSSAAAEGAGDESPAGSSASVANPEQASSSALAQSQITTDVGRRSIDDGQPSPPSRETSPSRTETGSDITYDDGPQDDGQDIGDTSAGVSEVALWNILISSPLTHRRVPSRIRSKPGRLPLAPLRAISGKDGQRHQQVARNAQRQSIRGRDPN